MKYSKLLYRPFCKGIVISLSVLIFCTLALGSRKAFSWNEKDYLAIKDYLNTVGNTFYWPPEISFIEIGNAANENAKKLWPFYTEEADERYQKIIKEVMGTAFEPVEDLSSNPLRVYLSVHMINEKDALAALIGVKITKPYLVLRSKDEEEYLEAVPVVIWEGQYMYIDEDYLSDVESSKYSFSETIDKYFKEFLNNFVNHILNFRNLVQ